MVLVVVSDLEDVQMVQDALMVALDDLDRIDFDDFGDELIVEIFAFDVHFGQDELLLLLDVAVAEVELFVGLELELNYSDGAFVILDSKIFILKPKIWVYHMGHMWLSYGPYDMGRILPGAVGELFAYDFLNVVWPPSSLVIKF